MGDNAIATHLRSMHKVSHNYIILWTQLLATTICFSDIRLRQCTMLLVCVCVHIFATVLHSGTRKVEVWRLASHWRGKTASKGLLSTLLQTVEAWHALDCGIDFFYDQLFQDYCFIIHLLVCTGWFIVQAWVFLYKEFLSLRLTLTFHYPSLQGYIQLSVFLYTPGSGSAEANKPVTAPKDSSTEVSKSG